MEIYLSETPFPVSMPFGMAAEHFYEQGVTLIGTRVVGEEAETNTDFLPGILP